MTASSTWQRVLAPAKVNPFLELLARRADGYHEIDTTLLALELADVVRARATSTGRIELSVEGPFASADIPLDARNLAWSGAAAALELARERGQGDRGLELVITKNVPSQAGLGGGSADAAAALRAAELALGLELPEERALAALAKLGSDCVFFRAAATTGHARATGRGERIELLPAPGTPLGVVVVTPEFGAPTAAVYRALQQPLRGGEAPLELPMALRHLELPPGRNLAFNRLEAAAQRAVPALAPWRALLDRAAPGQFTLSGSGSSFFALTPTPADADRLRSTVAAACAAAQLATRGLWSTRPAGHGAVPAP